MSSMTDRFSRLAALRPAHPPAHLRATLREPSSEDTLARLLGAGVSSNRYGEHLAVRNWFSTPEFVAPLPVALELLSQNRDAALARKMQAALSDPEKWLFLDTETTGLSGGTGTYAFLVGLAWWDAGGLQVEQLFMRDFTEEHSVLCELAARLAERPVLVTFNGKTFDWPLLQSRFTMTRAIPVPRLSAHLDLLHPARALWKFRLGSVKLVELERQVLDPTRVGWHREDDIASRFIPQFYFDYLRGGPPEPLTGIARHNQMDLRGLAALFGRINESLATEAADDEIIDGLDLFGLSKFLQRRGAGARANSACARALRAGLPEEYRPQARRQLATMAKRDGNHHRAAELWHEIAADSGDCLYAWRQLAIHYERREKDYQRALEFAQLALAHLQRPSLKNRSMYGPALGMPTEEQDFLKRIQRLQKRLEKCLSKVPCETLAFAGSGAERRNKLTV